MATQHTPLKRQPCKGCKSTVERIQDHLGFVTACVETQKRQIGQLLEQYGELAKRVGCPSQTTFFDPDPDVPEAEGNTRLEAATGLPWGKR